LVSPFRLPVLGFSRLLKIVKFVKGCTRTLLVQMKSGKTQTQRSKRGEPFLQMLSCTRPFPLANSCPNTPKGVLRRLSRSPCTLSFQRMLFRKGFSQRNSLHDLTTLVIVKRLFSKLRWRDPLFKQVDRLRVLSGRVPQDQKMLKGHLPRVINHQVY